MQLFIHAGILVKGPSYTDNCLYNKTNTPLITNSMIVWNLPHVQLTVYSTENSNAQIIDRRINGNSSQAFYLRDYDKS